MGPRCPDEYGVFLAPRAQTTRTVFVFNHNAIGEGFYTKFAKPKIVSPTAMAKLAIDSDRLESQVLNKSGDLHTKSGDFHYFIKNREISRQIERLGTWKLCLCALMHDYISYLRVHRKFHLWWCRTSRRGRSHQHCSQNPPSPSRYVALQRGITCKLYRHAVGRLSADLWWVERATSVVEFVLPPFQGKALAISFSQILRLPQTQFIQFIFVELQSSVSTFTTTMYTIGSVFTNKWDGQFHRDSHYIFFKL